MVLIVLSSGSKGNGYLLTNGKSTLVIEAGVPLSEVKKALEFDMRSIRGVLISHSHGDHFKYVSDYLKAGINVYCSQGTAMFTKDRFHHRLFTCLPEIQFIVGDFTVMPFDVQHDAEQPFGFLINHPETGNILFLTDSYFSEYRFARLNQVIIEINYDPEILDYNIESGRVNSAVRNRIITAHMGIGTAIDLLKINDLTQVNNIVLIHLSDVNSNAKDFQRRIEVVTGKTVTIADKGVEIELNKTPF